MAGAFIRPKRPSGTILRGFLDRQSFDLVLSTPILDELRRVLFCPRLRKELSSTDAEIQMRVASLGMLADLADGDLELRAVAADPDDDKYLVGALLGRAEFVVSGDHHLLDLVEYQGVTILTPRRFLAIVSDP